MSDRPAHRLSTGQTPHVSSSLPGLSDGQGVRSTELKRLLRMERPRHAWCTTSGNNRQEVATQSGQARWTLDKRCAKCGRPFERLAPSPECWCKTIKLLQPIRDQPMTQYAGCVCKTCLSLKFFPPNQLRSVWGIGRRERL